MEVVLFLPPPSNKGLKLACATSKELLDMSTLPLSALQALGPPCAALYNARSLSADPLGRTLRRDRPRLPRSTPAP
jgi:hypothetical protein